jgi:hypothetical protein
MGDSPVNKGIPISFLFIGFTTPSYNIFKIRFPEKEIPQAQYQLDIMNQ